MSSMLKHVFVTRNFVFGIKCLNMSTTSHYDIIIAGGGMVGCTMACALAKNEKLSFQKVLLLESSPKQEFELQKSYSKRVSAVNLHSKNLLISLGAWKHIEEMRACSVKKMQVWDACSNASIFLAHRNQIDLTCIVENDVILHAVNKELESSDNYNQIEIIHNSIISDYELPGLENKYSTIKMKNGDTYTCKLLIGADGANSKVRQVMNTQYISWNYYQKGIVATLELSEASENVTAWQRFLPTGPIALLPLDSTHSSLVWSMNSDNVDNLMEISDDEFVNALNHELHRAYPHNFITDVIMNIIPKIFPYVFSSSKIKQPLIPYIKCIEPSSRAAFPLGFGHSVQYVGDGVALIGDAAHRIHPLAGLGVNLGFDDILSLVNILSDSVYRGSYIGDKAHLLKYETERQRQVVAVSLVVDLIQKMYNTNNIPIVFLRSLIMQTADELDHIKQFSINQAIN